MESQVSRTPIEKLNMFHPGELVSWQRDLKNDVECRHLVMKNIQTLPVNRLKMFHGKAEDGYKATLHDANQGNIVNIHDWRSTPTERAFMDFLVEFEDRHPELILYSKNLNLTVSILYVNDFCSYCDFRSSSLTRHVLS
jgi:coproporphyrinogen III oxidase-like Fe-S oxidoreductase